MSTTTAPLTVEEFLRLPDIEDRRVELIDGEVVDMPSGGPAHETAKSNLNEILVAWLLQFAAIPSDAVIIVISRTGRSIEIVHLLAKARECGAIVIAVTNSEDGPLAQEAQVPIVIGAEFDHGISVNTYSTLAATAGALASASIGVFDDALTTSLSRAVAAAASSLAGWRQQIAESAWLLPGSVSYFLARGSSLGTCHEARLLWEEGVKSPATAMGTGALDRKS